MSRFPAVQPSNDVCHDKVLSNDVNNVKNSEMIYMAVPVGIPCILWFCYMNSRRDFACICVPICGGLRWDEAYEVDVGSSSFTLGYGTVVQGTLFAETLHRPCFAVEELLWYEGKRPSLVWEERMAWMEKVVAQCASDKTWTVKLPVLSWTPFTLADRKSVAYTIDFIRVKHCGNTRKKDVRMVFEVPPSPPSLPDQHTKSKWLWISEENAALDLYVLWNTPQKTHKVGNALISSYACSQWTRKLFRHVPNLENLEDSDDEDDDCIKKENENEKNQEQKEKEQDNATDDKNDTTDDKKDDDKENKGVGIGADTLLWKIQCHYHAGFRKWVPSQTKAIRVR